MTRSSDQIPNLKSRILNLPFTGIDRTVETCTDVDYYNAYDDLANEIEEDTKFWHHFSEDFERSEEACLLENKRDMSKFDFIRAT